MSLPFLWNQMLVLALGQPLSLKAQGNTVWLSSKEYLRAQMVGEKINLLPTKKGKLFASGFQTKLQEPFAVFITNPENISALKKCPHVSFNTQEGRLTYDSEKDIHQLAECNFSDISFEKTPTLSFSKKFLLAEQKLLKNGSIRELGFWNNGKRQIKITQNEATDFILHQIESPLRPFYEIIYEESATPGKTLIFELTLFEFSREKARDLGLKWPTRVSLLSLDQQGLAHAALSQEGKDLQLSADFGESQGVGKVLAQPTLRTQPGIESRFMSGGEIPIRNHNAFHSETVWKNYGLKINLKPSDKINPGDQEVSVDFLLEYSEPDPQHSVDGLPSLLQRQLQSRFDLRMEETTVLTTMVTLREGQSQEGVWGMTELPLLGALFSSKHKMKNNSELWFALRPSWDEISSQKNKKQKVELERGVF